MVITWVQNVEIDKKIFSQFYIMDLHKPGSGNYRIATVAKDANSS